MVYRQTDGRTVLIYLLTGEVEEKDKEEEQKEKVRGWKKEIRA